MLASMEKQQLTSDIQLPPGFRFHPSDEELIVHYLKNRVTSSPLPASVVAEIDLYKYNPWELPKKALFGEDEWYFFTPRERKYPNGARPNRAAASGYWKATGTDKPILTSCGTKSVGVKKALVFYSGRPPKGTKTDWIMHEYRLLDTMIWSTPKRKGSMRLDDWVLCRVRQRSSIRRNTSEDRKDPSCEQAGYLSKVSDLWPLDRNPNIEVDKNLLYNDCPMLPYILASHDLPSIETASSISFQSSDKSCNSVCEDKSDTKNLQFSVSSFESLFNPLKRKVMESHLRESFAPPSRKLTKRDSGSEEVKLSLSHDGSHMKFCGTYQSEGNNFSADQWDSIMQYEELNGLDFTE